jgi:outer membrane protein TolC
MPLSRTLSILVLLPWQVQGQLPLSVSQAVEKALSSHPLLAASQERIRSVEGLRLQSGLRPNPRFAWQTENLRTYTPPAFQFFEATDNFLYLTQTWETASKRSRRTELAQESVRRSQLEREFLERQIALRVRLAYWNALGNARLRQLLEENQKTFQQIVEYHEIRVREGAMAEADLIRVRIESERFLLALNSATLDAQRSRIQLFREMGQSDFPEVRFTEVLEDLPAKPPPTDPAQALSDRPEIRLARQAVDLARSNERLQQSIAKPNVDVLFGYKGTSGLHTALAGLQFDLPVSNTNQGNIAAAAADIRFAESSLAATEALVRAEVRAALAEYELRRRQVTESLKPLRDQALESSRIAEAAYRLGGADLLRLLDAERLRIDTQLLYYRTLSEFRQSLVNLEYAMGVSQ